TPVVDVAPTLSVAIDATGNGIETHTLTATPTLTTDDGGAGTGGNSAISYQWQDNGANISGATGSTYVVAETDEGKTITVVASFTDDTGQSTSATSNATTPVVDVAPTLSVAINATGNGIETHTLTATPTLTTDDGGAGTGGNSAISYQWQDNGANISGATGSTYVVNETDEGKNITVVG